MPFRYDPYLPATFPSLVTGILSIEGITPDVDVTAWTAPLLARAHARLGSGSESDLPEIRAWRAAFARMGFKPTQVRCAAEALLRRFRKEGALPSIHPLVDLCNAISLAFAVPVAVFDLKQVNGTLTVRPAHGEERYLTFGGEHETPEPGEIIFADEAGTAHARRWTNRQSAASAITPATTHVLIVAEALHEEASHDMPLLLDALWSGIRAHWPGAIVSSVTPQ